jgi:hypothetical protein
LVAIGIVVLGFAIAYGTRMWRQAPKDRFTTAERDAQTRENYRHGG